MSKVKKILFEVCVDSVESAKTAERNGANRLELCADLLEGGITPSYGMIKETMTKVSIPINVIIRPRGGDFLYTDSEFDVMKEDVCACKNFGVNGIVIGLLKSNGAIDKPRTKKLIDLAKPISVTFHRAFDMTKNPFKALDELIELGIERVLTSGQEADVKKGIKTLTKLMDYADNRIVIMPGGGVNEENIAEVISKTGVTEIHASARMPIKSKMKFKNPKTSMSDSKKNNEYQQMTTSGKRIKTMVQTLKRFSK